MNEIVVVLLKDTRFIQIAGVSLLAKTGILAASMLTGVAGFIWLYLVSKALDSEG